MIRILAVGAVFAALAIAQQPLASVSLNVDAAHVTPGAPTSWTGPGALAIAVGAIPSGSTGTISLAPGYSDTIASDLTVPAGVALVFEAGALVTVSSGITLTINSGTVACQQHCFEGPGTVHLYGLMGQAVPALWFAGTICNGQTDPANGQFNDDSVGLMMAHNSLPNAAGSSWPGGAVLLPYNNGCVINSTLTWSPYVRLRSASTSVTTTIYTAKNFAPVKAGTSTATITGVSCAANPCTVTATNGFANGDTVIVQGVNGPAVNSWQQLGPETVGSASGSSFTVTGAFGVPNVAWVSGGTAIDCTEKFAVIIANVNGSGNPNTNFNVDFSGFDIVETAAGNQCASGVLANTATASQLSHLNVSPGYRGFVMTNGTDNITIDSPTISAIGFAGGPDQQAIVLGSGGQFTTHDVAVTNMKLVNGGSGNGFTAQTPAVEVAGGPNNIYIGGNAEGTPWPVALNGTSFGPIVVDLTAAPDGITTTCPNALAAYPYAVWIGPSYTPGTPLMIYGNMNCYQQGVSLNGTAAPALSVPSSTSDIGPKSLGFADAMWDFLRTKQISLDTTSVVTLGTDPTDGAFTLGNGSLNYIDSETGVNNAIIGSLPAITTLRNGQCILINLAHSLQAAGANSFALNGFGALPIVRHTTAGFLTQAYAAGSLLNVCVRSGQWYDMSQ